MTENKFRERRSAYRDESAPEPEAPAAAAPPVSPSVDSPSLADPAPADSSAPADSFSPEPIFDVDEQGPDQMPSDPGLDLDDLAQMDVPEPAFLELVEPHVEMALRFLGELPLTPDGERKILPRWAKREIDLLGLLEQRTRGNLPPDEQRFLEQSLDHLRTLYLKVSR